VRSKRLFLRIFCATGILLLCGVVWFTYGLISVVHEWNGAAAEVESLGAEVRRLLLAPKYIYFDPGIDDAALLSARPALKKLVTVEHVHLTDTQISDAGLANLKVMHSLNRVVLTRTAVTAEGIADLTKRFPHIEINK